MNVTYDLSDDACKEVVYSCTNPLRLTGEWLTIYFGSDKDHNTVILVQTDESNVLLHEGVHEFRSINSKGPKYPWAFEITSAKPLVFDAAYSVHASIGGNEIHCGNDHDSAPFIAITLLSGKAYVFRVPDGAATAAWSVHHSSPMRQTVGDPVPRPRTPEADLSHPAVRKELDELVRNL